MMSCNIISGVRVPIAILGAEIDKYSPPQLLQQFQQILATKSEVYLLNLNQYPIRTRDYSCKMI